MFLGGGMRAHHPGQAVTVGDGDGAISQRLGGDHQLVRIRCPFEEGEIAGDVEFGVRNFLRPDPRSSRWIGLQYHVAHHRQDLSSLRPIRQTAHERTTAPD
jgi:hypothetical protein